MKTIELDNCINVRDISYGNIIPNKLIRSSSLDKISDNDYKKLYKDLKVKTVIDLRTKIEAEEEKDIIPSDVEYYNIPLVNEETLGITHGINTEEKLMNLKNNMPNMCVLYENLVTREKTKEWKKIFKILLNNDGTILWHCKQGKDRGGIVAAIIEYALGIDYNTIMEDYLYTNYYCINKANKMYKLMLACNSENELADEVKDLFIAKEEYLNSSFNYINNEYGSIDNFLKEICGINEKKRVILKEKYTKNKNIYK